MSLWVDKYRPQSLDELDHHPDLTIQLKRLCNKDNFPHCLFYGPPGAGKKTRIMGILRELYGPGAEKLKLEQRIFQTPSSRKIELTVTSSNYHIELTPSDVGIYDRVIVQDLIKEIAQTPQVSGKIGFKVVVLNEAHELSRDAQHALRRTMEKYVANLRLILCTNSVSQILAPIRSRCLLLRVEAPSNDQICQVMQNVAVNEGIKLPNELSQRLAEKSNGNLRRALLMLEATKAQQYPFTSNQVIPETDWQLFIEEVAHSIVSEQTPQKLLAIRSSLYELLSHCIPPTLILITLMECLFPKLDDSLKPRLIQHCAEYQFRVVQGDKPVFHLEAFVAKIMHMYKSHLMGMDMNLD